MQALKEYLKDIETRLGLQPTVEIIKDKYIYQYSLYLQQVLAERGDTLGKFVDESCSYISDTYHYCYSGRDVHMSEAG